MKLFLSTMAAIRRNRNEYRATQRQRKHCGVMCEVEQSLVLHGNILPFILFARHPLPQHFTPSPNAQHSEAFETIRMIILLAVPRPLQPNPRVTRPLLGYNDHDTRSIVQISSTHPRKLVRRAIKKRNGQINAAIMHSVDAERRGLCTRKCLSR